MSNFLQEYKEVQEEIKQDELVYLRSLEKQKNDLLVELTNKKNSKTKKKTLKSFLIKIFS